MDLNAFDELVHKWLDETIDQLESDQLQSELGKSAELRSRFRLHLGIDCKLRAIASAGEESNGARLRSIEAVLPVEQPLVWKNLFFWGVASALAASLCGFVYWNGWVSFPLTTMVDKQNSSGVTITRERTGDSAALSLQAIAQSEIEPKVVAGCAVLVRKAIVSFRGNEQFAVGDMIPRGRLRSESGSMQIDFFSGASMLVEGPADIEFHSPLWIKCNSGRISLRVPTPAAGFRVDTPGMDITDMGTEFGVNVEVGKPSQVYVFEGEVEAKIDGAKASRLTAGESLSSELGVPSRSQTGHLFPSISRMEKEFEEATRSSYDKWSEHIKNVLSDKTLIAAFIPEYSFDQKWGRVLSNLAESKDRNRDGAIIGATWTTGRWPSSKALEFKSSGDRVRMNLGEDPYEEITLSCWVRIDGIHRLFSGLLLTDGFQRGRPHWQIDDQGRMCFGLTYDILEDREDFRFAKKNSYLTPRLFMLSNQREWHHVAASCSLKTGEVIQYFDGQVVSRETLAFETSDKSLQFGTCELANWGVPINNADHPIRSLNGRLDEFLIFARELKQDEVSKLYLNGCRVEKF